MQKIKKFDKVNLELIRKDIDEALGKVCEKYGMNPVKIGSIKYSNNSFRVGTQFSLASDEIATLVKSGDLQSFVGRKFKMGQRVFTISEVRPENKLAGTTQRGVTYLLTPAQIASMAEVKY